MGSGRIALARRARLCAVSAQPETASARGPTRGAGRTSIVSSVVELSKAVLSTSRAARAVEDCHLLESGRFAGPTTCAEPNEPREIGTVRLVK